MKCCIAGTQEQVGLFHNVKYLQCVFDWSVLGSTAAACHNTNTIQPTLTYNGLGKTAEKHETLSK
jgi:hypothetical protein